ncbi:hypothetical protein BDZ91DRAFT_851058 [Kalaharituber pfeilii]|nr:hypothetical protein BDZ91DRAFT_851058 [Kalaharituber pfeilii]
MISTIIRSTFPRGYLNSAARSLSVISTRGVAAFGTRHENDPEILERGKKRVLDQQKPGSTEEACWIEEVASDSEAFVKAIRSEMKYSGKDIGEMTKVSEEIIKETRKKEKEEKK